MRDGASGECRFTLHSLSFCSYVECLPYAPRGARFTNAFIRQRSRRLKGISLCAVLGYKAYPEIFNSALLLRVPPTSLLVCVPITSPTSCHQAIFVDQATDLSPSSDAVQVEVDRLG